MLRLKTLCLFLFAGHSAFALSAEQWIEPAMIDIPAGQLNTKVTTELLKDLTKPDPVTPTTQYQRLNVKSFRLGKFEVTIREFSQFIVDTNYPAPTSCMQMDKQWFNNRAGNWNKNQHTSSEYEPVTCIGWKAAQAYVEWLSKKTGKSYRLPSEAEWEYAARAGTTTDYYWGTDAAQACQFANIADEEAEAAIKRDYDGLESKGHVGVVPCNDKTGYASVVGLYKPNAFGLYDMIGNIAEFASDCLNNDYPGTLTDGSSRQSGDCSKHMVRGGTWHWAPFIAGGRVGMPDDFIGSLEGFRIAEDITSNSSNKKTKATRKFERELAKAQKASLKKF